MDTLLYMIGIPLGMFAGFVIGAMCDIESVTDSSAGKIVGLIGGALFGVLLVNLFMSI